MLKDAPISYIYKRLLFPFCNIFVPVKISSSVRLSVDDHVVIYPVRGLFDLVFSRGRIATLGRVVSLSEAKGVEMAEVHGISRVVVRKRSGLFKALYETVEFEDLSDKVQIDELRKMAQEFVFLVNVPESDKLIYLLNFISTLSELSDFVSHYFVMNSKVKIMLYNERDPAVRGRFLGAYIEKMIKDMEIKNGRI